LEEAVLRNIDACKELAETTRSAYGPFGMTLHACFPKLINTGKKTLNGSLTV